MFVSLIAFSQKDTIPTNKCFPVPIVRLITKDLLSGDSAKALLKLTEQQLDSTIRKTYIQDSIIGTYKQKEENFNSIIKIEREKFGTLQSYTNKIEKKNKILVIAEEYRKCGQDPIYFMKKYCVIQHPTRGKIPFHLYPFQEECLTDFKDNRFNIILKSRQLGLSTLSAGYILWKMLFNQDFNALVIATKVTVAKNLVEKVRVMHDLLPVWLRDGGNSSVEDNKLSLKLKNGSQCKAIASSPDAGRSEALSLLVVDEAAFIRDIDEIWLSAQSTLSTGGAAIVLSTPNGVGNWFHKMWVDGESGANGFHNIRLHWTVHPERNQDWRDEQTRILGIKGAAQECDCDFVSSGDTVIDPQLLMWYKDTYVVDPIQKRGFDGNLWIWEHPNYNRQYMVVADVARGDSSDYSAAQVIDIEDCSQVAEYRGKIETKDFGNFLVSLATEYNNALLVIENANVGWACIQQVIDRGYANLFYMSNDLKYIDVERQMTNRYYREERQMVAGFSTTAKTRPLIISSLDSYIQNKDILIRSVRLIDELFTFIWNGGRAEAMKGYNDDLTMSMGIGLWVRNTALRLKQEGIDLTKSMLNSTQISNYNGVYTINSMKQNPYEMDIGNKEKENLTWLLR